MREVVAQVGRPVRFGPGEVVQDKIQIGRRGAVRAFCFVQLSRRAKPLPVAWFARHQQSRRGRSRGRAGIGARLRVNFQMTKTSAQVRLPLPQNAEEATVPRQAREREQTAESARLRLRDARSRRQSRNPSGDEGER